MWRRTTEDEIRNTGRSLNEVKRIAGDRNPWKLFMDVKEVKGHDDDDYYDTPNTGATSVVANSDACPKCTNTCQVFEQQIPFWTVKKHALRKN
jgi:hypothetical protein